MLTTSLIRNRSKPDKRFRQLVNGAWLAFTAYDTAYRNTCHTTPVSKGVSQQIVQTVGSTSFIISTGGSKEQPTLSITKTFNNKLSKQATVHLHNSSSYRLLLARLYQQAATTFLPAGYPGTVGPNYLAFVGWQALHHAAASANGVLSSTFLLYSVGLGAGSIPLAGALNWVLKDGLGQLGTLLFGRLIAHKFDIDTKFWYVMASLKLDFAIGLEISSFLYPAAFLPMASLANAMKGLAWMAGGSTRTALNMAFVRSGNIADITARATSQTICTSLLGTAAGIGLTATIGPSPALALMAFAALSALHLYGAYRSVSLVPLASLNHSRLRLLAAAFLSQQTQAPGSAAGNPTKLPSPVDLVSRDPVLLPLPNGRYPDILVGTSLPRLLEEDPGLLQVLLATYQHEKALVVPHAGAVHIILHSEALAQHSIQAYLQAVLLHRQLKMALGLQCSKELILMQQTLAEAKLLSGNFRLAMQAAGWHTDHVLLEPHRSRAEW